MNIHLAIGPLIAPAIMGTSPFYVLLYYWSFKRLPAELFEAARLEGLGPLKTWWRVAMPLVRPVTVAVGVLAFVFTWGNFLDPLIFVFDQEKFTVPLGLRALATLDRTNFPLLLAGSVAATLPVIVAFLYVQRYFLQEHRGPGGQQGRRVDPHLERAARRAIHGVGEGGPEGGDEERGEEQGQPEVAEDPHPLIGEVGAQHVEGAVGEVQDPRGAIDQHDSQRHQRVPDDPIGGHEERIEQVFIALFCGGHCLLEGVPGLGKTLMVRSLGEILSLSFSRIQFTPDLMPADITGTNMLTDDPTGRKVFEFQRGPVFANIVVRPGPGGTPARSGARTATWSGSSKPGMPR